MSYFRILVSVNGQKLFRTSRLFSAKVAQNTYNGVCKGFTGSDGYTIEILAVGQDGMESGQGLIIDETALEDYVVAELEDQGVIGPLSTPPETEPGFVSAVQMNEADDAEMMGDYSGDFDPAQSPAKDE